MKNIKVIVATHKEYKMSNDELYLPMQVGAANSPDLGILKDSTKDNISKKNPYFCELTALYFAYKNLDYDYIGLCHYRRYFKGNKKVDKKDKFNSVLTLKEAQELLKNTDIILPKKRRYYIENLYDHYKHTMYIEPLDETRNIIKEKYSKYLEEFDKLKKRKSAHMFNMFIMKKNILDDYSKWLFDILFELESRMKNKKYDKFHSRFYGRISELLLDVYINTNKLKYTEIGFIDMENINWVKKGSSFLKAKFLNKKYDKSF